MSQPQVTIKRQNRKSLLMRLTPQGDVVVFIPHWIKAHDPQVKKFIRDGLKKIDAHLPVEPPPQLHDARIVRALVRRWAARMNLKPRRISLRPMTRKWGSCSTRGSITLNTALYYVPHHLMEYVVVHELAHMLVFNHGPEFWAKMGEFLPDYEARERELNTYRV